MGNKANKQAALPEEVSSFFNLQIKEYRGNQYSCTKNIWCNGTTGKHTCEMTDKSKSKCWELKNSSGVTQAKPLEYFAQSNCNISPQSKQWQITYVVCILTVEN